MAAPKSASRTCTLVAGVSFVAGAWHGQKWRARALTFKVFSADDALEAFVVVQQPGQSLLLALLAADFDGRG